MKLAQSVGRAERDDTESHRGRHREGGLGREAIARDEVLDRDETRLERAERRAQGHRGWRREALRHAVEHAPGIDGVQERVAVLHDERAARGELDGCVDAGRGEPVEHGREPAELPVHVRGVCARRGVQVRQHASQAQTRHLADGEDHLDRLLGGNAEPLEPGIHLDEDLAGLAGGGAIGGRLVDVRQGRDETVGEDLGRRRGQRVRVDEDRQRGPLAARPDRIGEIGEGKPVGPMSGEDLRHLAGSEPVAIGLEHREDLPPGADEPPYRSEILGHRVDIDLEPRRSQQTRPDAHGAALLALDSNGSG